MIGQEQFKAHKNITKSTKTQVVPKSSGITVEDTCV